MNKFNKIVASIALIVFIYGLQSYFNLGEFIVPLFLLPLIQLSVAILFLLFPFENLNDTLNQYRASGQFLFLVSFFGLFSNQYYTMDVVFQWFNLDYGWWIQQFPYTLTITFIGFILAHLGLIALLYFSRQYKVIGLLVLTLGIYGWSIFYSSLNVQNLIIITHSVLYLLLFEFLTPAKSINNQRVSAWFWLHILFVGMAYLTPKIQ